MQKKIIKSFIIGVIIFVSFMIFYDIDIKPYHMYYIMNIVTVVLTIVFATCSQYMVFNNLYNKIDLRACTIALSYFVTSLLLMINILCIANQAMGTEMIMKIRKNNLYRNILEIIILVISTKFISKISNIKRHIFIIISIGIIGIYLSIRNTVFDYSIMDNDRYCMIEDIVGILILAIGLIGGMLRKHKLTDANFTDDKRFINLYFNRALNGILIIWISNSSTFTNILYNLLDLMFYIGVFSYVCDSILDVEWKSIELKKDSKEEEVQRKLIEKRILVASAKSVRKKIKYITKNTKEIKEIAKIKEMEREINYIQKIIKNCNRLTKLSQNIVSLNKYDSGIETVKFEKVDMVVLINELSSSIEPYLEDKNLRLQSIISDKEIICDADREAIERILLNLVSNSVKYSKQGGDINIICFTKKEKVYLLVQDKGVGIPEHLINTVFNQYARAESDLIRQQEGSGLGLTIVKSLVELHGGEIEIKSKVDRGTSINIMIPICQKYNTVNKYNSSIDREIIKKVEIEFSDIEV